MLQIKSIALSALLIAGLAGTASAANAESTKQANNTAQAQVSEQANRRVPEVAFTATQDRNPWVITAPSGVHIQSRAGFVGYR